MQQKTSRRPNFARTTISVPRQLKQRMKRQGQLVNWSAVATAAFREKLNSMDEEQQVRSLDSVVARLQQSEEGPGRGNRALKRGERCGRQWAMDVASAAQLRRLAEFRAGFDDQEWTALFESAAGWRKLARTIDPQTKQPRRTWRRILHSHDDPQAEFYAAFVKGALDLWEQVADRLPLE